MNPATRPYRVTTTAGNPIGSYATLPRARHRAPSYSEDTGDAASVRHTSNARTWLVDGDSCTEGTIHAVPLPRLSLPAVTP